MIGAGNARNWSQHKTQGIRKYIAAANAVETPGKKSQLDLFEYGTLQKVSTGTRNHGAHGINNDIHR